MGGGPSKEQKNAAAAEANLSNTEAQAANRAETFKENQQALVNPFYTERLKNGLPYLPTALDYAGGTNARAFAPARADLLRRIGTGTGLPSGYRDQALTDFDENRANAYDDSIMGLLAANEQAKQNAAGGLLGQAQLADPTAYFQLANGGNSSIMNAPLQSPGFAGTLGSLIGAGATVGSKFIKPRV